MMTCIMCHERISISEDIPYCDVCVEKIVEEYAQVMNDLRKENRQGYAYELFDFSVLDYVRKKAKEAQESEDSSHG